MTDKKCFWLKPICDGVVQGALFDCLSSFYVSIYSVCLGTGTNLLIGIICSIVSMSIFHLLISKETSNKSLAKFSLISLITFVLYITISFALRITFSSLNIKYPTLLIFSPAIDNDNGGLMLLIWLMFYCSLTIILRIAILIALWLKNKKVKKSMN